MPAPVRMPQYKHEIKQCVGAATAASKGCPILLGAHTGPTWLLLQDWSTPVRMSSPLHGELASLPPPSSFPDPTSHSLGSLLLSELLGGCIAVAGTAASAAMASVPAAADPALSRRRCRCPAPAAAGSCCGGGCEKGEVLGAAGERCSWSSCCCSCATCFLLLLESLAASSRAARRILDLHQEQQHNS
jgi:hypothetical protein